MPCRRAFDSSVITVREGRTLPGCWCQRLGPIYALGRSRSPGRGSTMSLGADQRESPTGEESSEN